MEHGAINATYQQGQIIPETTKGLVEGQQLLITTRAACWSSAVKPNNRTIHALEAWVRALESAPTLTLSPQEEADLRAWQTQQREFNLNAVRAQMEHVD